MKTILVPTDFSDCAAAAYSYAAVLAKKTNATIHLLHILEVSMPSLALGGEEETTQDTHFMMELMKATHSRMKKVAEREEFKGLEVVEMVEVGVVPDMIYTAVQKHNCDMIVMGTHGGSGFQEKFIGTNAEKVVRNVEIPVLSVKHAVKDPKVDSIFFATDFSDETAEVLPAVSKITHLFKAKLTLGKVITPLNFESSAQTQRKMETFTPDNNGLHNYSLAVFYGNTKESGIHYGAKQCGADLIALGTHGRHGLAHFFQGSVAEDVVNHAALPVLTINFRKKEKNRQPASSGKEHHYDSDLLYQVPAL